MRWDFSLELGDARTGTSSQVEVRSLVVYKTLYDDNNVELTKVATTAKDAFENAEPGFLEEYRTTALQLFSEQLNGLFAEREVYSSGMPALGLLFGNSITAALRDLVTLQNGEN